ncbi:uncharacterized protein N7459_007944 [Penicillium hispanicum]|uniref:uncharacterized protein n=1 Tax=Penicillium hispanicum TaxID=1080232 RepID=UPI0025407C36|nr:uncharacterized protein N7459_007944 [Penicillium hispanicum]KAJ5573517.1 hypothetical protein N7459_007944 [Penicillium hispanicum]
MPELSATERKRLRDRRAQQTLRDKKLRQITTLQEQLAHCEQHHNEHGVQQLLQTIQGLRQQNESLLARQRSLKSLVDSWEGSLEATCTAAAPLWNPWMFQRTSHSDVDPSQIPPSLDGSRTPGSMDYPQESDVLSSTTLTPPSHLQLSSMGSSAEAKPAWNHLPHYTDNFSDTASLSCPWLLYPEQIIPCPDTPSSPLDILYGTKTNPLANGIHTALQRRPIRDPERLGFGWLAYHFARWILSPSPRTYEKLPAFLQPVQDQLRTRHPLVLDFIPWPKMRVNLIQRWHIYEPDRDGLFGMFWCCIKIRWPWGEKILERNEDNELAIKPAFYEIFMREEGWGLTPEFISRYPDLVAGMDIGSLVFTMT